MDFQQIRDFVNPAVAQATGIEPVDNLSMPVPVAYVPVQLVIDGALSPTSENPVQNKVIAVAIQNLDGRITAIEGQFSEGVTEAVNNWLDAHPEATTTVQDGAITYAKLDANLKGEVDQISDLKSALNGIAYPANLESYLYKTNKYVNNSMEEVDIDGYNLYRLPCKQGDLIYVGQPLTDEFPFWHSISDRYVFRFVYTDGSYSEILGTTNGYSATEYYFNPNRRFLLSVAPANCIAISISAHPSYINNLKFGVNCLFPSNNNENLLNFSDAIYQLNDKIAFKTDIYRVPTPNSIKYTSLGSPGYALSIMCHNGDIISFSALPTGFSFYGTFLRSDNGDCVKIEASKYTIPCDGLLFAFINLNDVGVYISVDPANSIRINAKNVSGLGINDYAGLTGVAFGTSLTYRAITTGGFLQYLEPLSEIAFDNQGLGSSTILPVSGQPEMMPKITEYSGYTGKKICLLEGFVNDWYYNPDKLGTWKDNGQTTVCGCVRYAINYIWTQNPNLTIFLILDHFGQGITASTALNSNGQTQFEWWAEIEKVALSMGVRVIREYEISEISEKTPQYLLDNIHLNAVGAEQSANAIWSVMRQGMPNI